MRELLLSMRADRWVLPALVLWPMMASAIVWLAGRDAFRDDATSEVRRHGVDARVLTDQYSPANLLKGQP